MQEVIFVELYNSNIINATFTTYAFQWQLTEQSNMSTCQHPTQSYCHKYSHQHTTHSFHFYSGYTSLSLDSNTLEPCSNKLSLLLPEMGDSTDTERCTNSNKRTWPTTMMFAMCWVSVSQSVPHGSHDSQPAVCVLSAHMLGKHCLLLHWLTHRSAT